MKNYVFLLVACLPVWMAGAQKTAFLDKWQPKDFITFREWQEVTPPQTNADVTITVNRDSVVNVVRTTMFGNNLGSWMNKNCLTDATKKRHFKNAANTLIRWPGGNGSNKYFWDGNIPSSTRTDPKYDTPVSGTDGVWRLTNNQYLQMLDTLGAQGIVCVNASYALYGTGPDPVGTAAHYAADWVRYFNNTKGYNIKYWEVGNENYGAWQAGYLVDNVQTTGTRYGEIFRVFADSMKQADPSIQVGAVVFPEDGRYSNWSALVLPEVEDHADFLIIHEYFHPDKNRNDIAEQDIYDAYTKVGVDKQQVEAMVETYTDKPAGYFPIAMTEFNARSGTREISRTNALFVAMCLGEFIRHDYAAVMIWDMQNGYSATEGGDHGMLSHNDPLLPEFSAYPTVYTYYYYDRYFGDQMVSATSDNSDVKVYASTFRTGEVGLVLVNTGSQAHVVELNVENVALGERLYFHTITGDSDMDRTVYINGQGPAGGSAGVSGPQNYEAIEPYSHTISGRPSFESPPYSASFMLLETDTVVTALRERSMMGNDRNDGENEVTVYPNPTGQHLFVKTDRMESLYYAVYNVHGQKMSDGCLVGKEKGVGLSVLPEGIYFIRLYNHQTSVCRMFQKTK